MIALMGFALFAATSFGQMPFVAIMVAFALFGGAVLYQLYGIRCPRCRGNLGGPLAYAGGSPFGASPKAHNCLYCGVNLDDEIEHPQERHA